MKYLAWVPLVVLTFALPLSVLLTAQGSTSNSSAEQRNWPAYGGGPEDTRYSPLNQINRSNVQNLQVAWTYDTGEKGGLQTSPIMVGGVLYGITPAEEIFALDAATGKELWKFGSANPDGQPNRGLSYWADGEDKRVLVGIEYYEYELDARTGKPVPTFRRKRTH